MRAIYRLRSTGASLDFLAGGRRKLGAAVVCEFG
jgi:hypothetical protein